MDDGARLTKSARTPIRGLSQLYFLPTKDDPERCHHGREAAQPEVRAPASTKSTLTASNAEPFLRALSASLDSATQPYSSHEIFMFRYVKYESGILLFIGRRGVLGWATRDR